MVLLDFFSDFLDVGWVFFFELLDDGLQLIDLGLKLLDVIFFVDGFLYSDFVVLGWAWEEFVVLDDFGGELGFEVLLGLFEGRDLLVETGDLLFRCMKLFESSFSVNFFLINFI